MLSSSPTQFLANDIRDATSLGKELLKAVDAAAARASLLLGSASVEDVSAFDAAGAASNAISTHEAAGDPHPQYLTAAEGNAAYDVIGAAAAAQAASQPLDTELTALASTTSAADKLPYFTGSGTATVATFTSVARTLVGQVTQSLMLTAGLGLSANGQSLVTSASYETMRGLLDLEAGTDFYSISAADAAFQPKDATLTALAALTIAANTLTVGTGADAFSQTTFATNTFPGRASTGNLEAKTVSDFALTILDDADAATVRTTIGANSASNINAGTLAVANGGTNIASYAVGDLLYASAATTLAKLADVAVGSVLVSGGVTTAPAWSSTPQLAGLGIGTTATSGRLDVLGTASGASVEAARFVNETNTTGSTVKTLYKIQSAGFDAAKGGFAFERTGTFGRGKLYVLLDSAADNNVAVLADFTVCFDATNTLIGTATSPTSAVRNITLASGTLGAAAADQGSVAVVDDGAGNAVWQFQSEAGSPVLVGNDGFRSGLSGERLAIYNSSATQGRIEKTSASGPSVLLLNPLATDGVSTAYVGIGRLTNTTGLNGVYIFTGDGAGTAQHALLNNSDSYVCASNGEFGIGTSTLQRGLHYENATPIFRISDGNSTTTTNATGLIEFFHGNNTTLLGYVGFSSSVDQNMEVRNFLSGDLELWANNKQWFTLKSGGSIVLTGGSTTPAFETAAADTVVLTAFDTIAGQRNLYAQNEVGKRERITGLREMLSSQFDKTNTTLASITGLTHRVEAGKRYAFRVVLFVDMPTGGYTVDMGGGTCTVTVIRSLLYHALEDNANAAYKKIMPSLSGLYGTTLTNADIGVVIVEGSITINAAGTLIPRFAQKTAGGTSSVQVGSYFELIPIGD